MRTTEDPDLLRRLIDEGVAFEVCPTSNVHLGVYQDFSHVPLPVFMKYGATVALGADDPLLFRSRLVQQYARARDTFSLSDQQIADLASQSINASLASSASKNQWHAHIQAWLNTPPYDGHNDSAEASQTVGKGRSGRYQLTPTVTGSGTKVMPNFS